MLSTLDADWILDPETKKVMNVSELCRTGFFCDAISNGNTEWAAYIDGFVVDDVSSPAIHIPDSRSGVAVNVPQLKEFYDSGLLVGLVKDGETLHIKEESMTGELGHLSPVMGD